jgi:hypothetical protein
VVLHKIYGNATGVDDERRHIFARPHATLTKAAGGYPTTPAMAAGVANRVWSHREIAALLG